MVKKVAPIVCISRLPLDILHHILSLLPTKDVLRARVLSKTWKVVVDSYPVLDFNYFEFLSAQELKTNTMVHPEGVTNGLHRKLIERRFMDYVDASMLKFLEQNLQLQAFTFKIHLRDWSLTWVSAFEKWVRQVIENGVKEFRFSLCYADDSSRREFYSLPRVAFAATSIAVLKLHGLNLELEDSCSVELHSLRKLKLTNVLLDDHTFWKLAAGCPLLEVICLRNCKGMKNIQIAGFHKLKKLSIESVSDKNFKTIKIETPLLESAYFDSFRGNKPVIEFGACQSLKSLCIHGGFSATEGLFRYLIPKFPVLESLDVNHTTMKPVKISSFSLKRLHFHVYNTLSDLVIDTPNLLSCRYNGHIPSFSLINAPLCQLELFPTLDTIDIPWYVKLKEFLANFNHIALLTISGYDDSLTKILFNLEDLSNISSPFSVAENFVLSETGKPSISFLVPLVDGLFRCCRPKTMFINCGDCESRNVEFLSNLVNKEDLSCCNDREAKCWRHHLKEVKVESFENNTDRWLPYSWSSLPEGYSYCKLEWLL